MKRKILFRADGNASTGLGHLYRLFSLVEMIKLTHQFQFLTKQDSTTKVIPTEYNHSTIPEHITIEDEPLWLAHNFEPSQHLIIIDGYHFTKAYQSTLKKHGFNLIFVDDLARIKMVADVVINHSPYIRESDFDISVHTNLALGTKYALLRPAFLKAAQEKSKFKCIHTAFVCFGGADPLDLSTKVIKALLSFNVIQKIHIVLGAAFSSQELHKIQTENLEKIIFHRNLSESDLVNVMQSCNFGVVPASTILYELCCFKMPILSGFFVDNQELIYKGFLDESAIFKGGNFKNYDMEDFISILNTILHKQDFSKQITAQEKMFDKNIKTRHLKIINALCSS